MLFHGGYWRVAYTRVLMSRLARALARSGWAAWNVEYRRVGLFGHGGWPVTLADVASAVDFVSQLPGVDDVALARVVTCGHSAGGQLALWAAARHRAELEVLLPVRVAPPAPGPSVSISRAGGVRLAGAVSLAGVVDLEAGERMHLGAGAVVRFLGGTPAQVPERYRAASPAALVPLGVPQVLIHGDADAVVPPSMAADYAAHATAAGDEVALVTVTGAGHRDLVRPRGAAWRHLSMALEGFAPRANGS